MEHIWTEAEQREHRRLWVEALRSGKYQQGDIYLHRASGRMCCLGVACDLSGLAEWVPGSDPDAPFRYGVPDEREESAAAYVSVMPFAVRQYFGLASCDGEFGEHSLTDLNDSGKTFAEIADIIEAEPEGLIAKATSS